MAALDILLMMDRRLIQFFDVEEHFPEDADEQVGFDQFYEQLSRWATEQTDLTYEDFSAIDNDRKERIGDFKNKVDHLV